MGTLWPPGGGRTTRQPVSVVYQGSMSWGANLGVIYDNGEGVPVNHAEAEKWYRLAAEQGNFRVP